MARRGDLAGLAALGALGYMLSKGNKAAPAMGGSSAASVTPDAGPSITDDMRQRAIDEGNKVSEGERVSRYKPNVFDVEDARAAPAARPSGRPTATTAPSVRTGVNPRDSEAGTSRGTRASTPMGGSGRGGQGGPTAAELEAYDASRQSARPAARSLVDQIPLDKPREPVKGERINSTELGRNLSNIAMASAGMTGAGAMSPALRSMQNAGMYGKVGTRPDMAQQAIGAAERQALSNNPTRQITGPSKSELVARDRAARAAQRQQAMGEENAARYNLDPSAPGYAEKAADIRSRLGGSDFSLPLKRGGKVKVKPKKMASGGMTGSASKRADGIATKGKTRGKIC
jgi:hypothetical protein